MLSASLNITTSASASAVTLSWTGLESNAITGYQVMCINKFLQNNTEQSYSQSSSHTVSVITNNSTNSVEVRNLVPGFSYNCCISALEESNNIPLYCEDSLMLGSGLSWPVIGVIGAAVGAVLAMLILLIIVGIVGMLCKTCRSV